MADFQNDTVTMAAVCENDYLYQSLDHEMPADAVMMYPNLNVVHDDTMVSWDAPGSQLVKALGNSDMTSVAEQDGYRVVGATSSFVSAVNRAGYTVPDRDAPPAGLQFDSSPVDGKYPWQALEALACEVTS
jgi:hypothetical protein